MTLSVNIKRPPMFVLKRQDSVQPLYYSCKVGRDYGAASAWSVEQNQALKFATEADAEDFMKSFVPSALLQVTVLAI